MAKKKEARDVTCSRTRVKVSIKMKGPRLSTLQVPRERGSNTVLHQRMMITVITMLLHYS